MKILLIIALLIPTGCWRRFKRLGRHIMDDIMIDLVYCPVNKRLKQRDRMSKWRRNRDGVEQVMRKDRELYTSVDVGLCKDQDLKVIPVKIPGEELENGP